MKTKTDCRAFTSDAGYDHTQDAYMGWVLYLSTSNEVGDWQRYQFVA